MKLNLSISKILDIGFWMIAHYQSIHFEISVMGSERQKAADFTSNLTMWDT